MQEHGECRINLYPANPVFACLQSVGAFMMRAMQNDGPDSDSSDLKKTCDRAGWLGAGQKVMAGHLRHLRF